MEVLVVDDKEPNRKLLKGLLIQLGYDVLEADSGEQAISVFEQHRPDIVLMDIMMPGVDGYGATSKIKSLSGEIYTPVIYVTALKPEEAMAKAVEAGGDDYVTKPVNFEILISKLNAHTRIKEASIQLAEANRQLKSHNTRLVRENQLAEEVFSNALNKSLLDERFIRYQVLPCSNFNGDVLLVEKKPNDNICVLLGDFTGHGLSAALGTLPVVKVFFTMVKKGLALEDIVKELNETIKMLLPSNIFLSASLVELDASTSKATAWTGGLPPMVIVNHSSGEISSITSQHMPLGILSSDEFETCTTSFNLEDSRVYLFTDGVTEAINDQGDMYGNERLEKMLQLDGEDLFDKLTSDHAGFTGDTEQKDDITLVELRVDELPL